MFLLDTCVISEGSKRDRDENVRRWLSEQDTPTLYISAITAGELRYGVDRRSPGRETTRLRGWLQETLQRGFEGRILAFDYAVAEVWGNLPVGYPNAEIADLQIAATALAHGMTLVTRNVKHFPFEGLAVFNPWQD